MDPDDGCTSKKLDRPIFARILQLPSLSGLVEHFDFQEKQFFYQSKKNNLLSRPKKKPNKFKIEKEKSKLAINSL